MAYAHGRQGDPQAQQGNKQFRLHGQTSSTNVGDVHVGNPGSRSPIYLRLVINLNLSSWL